METPEERTKKRDAERAKLKTSRKVVRQLVTKLVTEIEGLLTGTSCQIEDVEDAVALLQQKEEAIIQYDAKIEALFDDEKEQANDTLKAYEYRDKITITIRKANRRISNIKGAVATSNSSSSGTIITTGSATSSSQVHAKLPKLTISKYGGDFTQWGSFWHQFSIAVDKQDMSKVEKFTYLESYLVGDAKMSLKGMYASDENYDEAIRILKDRFGRPDMVKYIHLNILNNLEPVTKVGDLRSLRNLYDQCEVNIRSLKSLGENIAECGTFLCPKLLKCLPEEIRLEYSRTRKPDADWNIVMLLEFLKDELQSRETCQVLGAKSVSEKHGGASFQYNQNQDRNQDRRSQYPRNTTSALSAGVNYRQNPSNQNYNQNRREIPQYEYQDRRNNVYCIFCEETTHKTANCEKFNIEQKKNFIRDQGRCNLCLRSSHEARNCHARYRTCLKCKKGHNYAICYQNPANIGPERKEETRENVETNVNVGVASINIGKSERKNTTVLLQTARAIAKHPEENHLGVEIRCFLDSGAQASFIREDIARKLNLPIIGEAKIGINKFMSREISEHVRNKVKITLENIEKPEERVEIVAIEVPFVCNSVTTFDCDEIEDYMKDRGWQLADKSNNAAPILGDGMELLIGGDFYWAIASGRTERFGPKVVAIETKLGWAVQGPVDSNGQGGITSCPISVMRVGVVEKETDKIVKGFWELESIGIVSEDPKSELLENDQCIQNFNSEIKMNNGRYHVKFPWRIEKEVLPDNLEIATKRANALVRRFKRDPLLYDDYKAVIEEQLKTGVAEVVENPNEKPAGTFYLPHQPVKREAAETTKLRVVLDGSSSAKGSPSLNDCLASGPNLTPDILLLLLRFRLHKIAFIADIEKAFLQVALSETERDSVRFLWVKEGPNKQLEENKFVTLRMARVPFGITSSPFLLASSIKYHIHSVEGSDKNAVKLIDRDLYVDDLVSGENNVEAAFTVSMGINEVMSTASMRFRKWQTNSARLRELWGNTKSENEVPMFEGKDAPEGIKVLGLKWNPNSDTYSFDLTKLVEIFQNIKPTKRHVISAVAQIFDPIGILAPFTIRAKMLFQKLWVEKVAWDERLSEQLEDEFISWCRELPSLRHINIPRHYFDSYADIQELELHCFTDASKSAYAVTIYVRYVTQSNYVGVSLVTSKARVAPLKELSVPKLELMGCNLGARLTNYVKETFSEKLVRTYMWCDSTIALYWIRGATSMWKPFISNRAAEIQRLTNIDDWRHCPGIENPSDIPTRGITAEKLASKQLWWEGPDWLKKPKSEWPEDKSREIKINAEEIEKELRKTIMVVNCQEKIGLDKIINLEKYSNLDKCLRITCYVKRAFKQNRARGPITAEEMVQAEIDWVRCAQQKDFPNELATIKENKKLKPSSSLASLNPIMNYQGQLCVGGRLDQTDLSLELKHPIILNAKQHLARMITQRSHCKVLHNGVQDTITQVRGRYWIVAGRQLAKKIVKECLICRKENCKAGDAPTAPLPKDRIEQAPPFQICGIDFAGPLYIKGPSYYENNKTLDKAYICLITCAVTRALHLELMPSLSTEEFMLAFRRMIARRGIPHTIYSDNAKTFEKANKDLQSVWKKLNDATLLEYFGREGIRWKFIAERAAWWGGFYERLVRSTKSILKKVLGSAKLNYQELETTLVEAEAAINSRPITFVYSDTRDPSPLSPAQFLIGQRITTLPPQRFTQTNQNSNRELLTKRLKYRENLNDKLWKRWQQEYVLQLRSAHHTDSKKLNEIQLKDVVLVHQDKIPKHVWKLGVVEEKLIGRDQKVRACIVRMSNGTKLRRPIQLLYPMEIGENNV